MPHGHCFLWQPGLIWLHVTSDSLIALAYYSIPLTLLYFVKKRKGLAVNGLIVGFGAFIVACGTTHLMSVWDLWHGTYRLEGLIKAITAGLSVATAIACVRLIPAANKIPTATETERMNSALQSEIDARKQTGKKLEALLETRRAAGEAKLSMFVEAVAEGILLVSDDGTIHMANRRMEEMFGYAREEMQGQKLGMLIPERYRARHALHREGYFAAPSVRAMGAGRDLTGQRKDGSEFPVEIGLSFVETDEGKLALALVSDITERKRVESEFARINSELVRSNTELGQFAYVASHDLQEPLRMVTGYLQLLEKRYKGQIDQEGTEFIHYAVEGAVRMKRLIEDLLALSRAGTQKASFRPVDSRILFQAACSNLSVAIRESGAEVTCGSLPTIIADTGLLTQAFQNLIGNAIKFRRKDTAPRVHLTAELVKDAWLFSIRDNGIGIEARHLDRIFGIFERLHSSDQYEGSGVGLAITQRIVERHGGRVWVESTMGQGSTFFFLIPTQPAVQDLNRASAAKS